MVGMRGQCRAEALEAAALTRTQKHVWFTLGRLRCLTTVPPRASDTRTLPLCFHITPPPRPGVPTVTICSDEVLHLGLLIPGSPAGGDTALKSGVCSANPWGRGRGRWIRPLRAAGGLEHSPPRVAWAGGSWGRRGVRGSHRRPGVLAPWSAGREWLKATWGLASCPARLRASEVRCCPWFL